MYECPRHKGVVNNYSWGGGGWNIHGKKNSQPPSNMQKCFTAHPQMRRNCLQPTRIAWLCWSIDTHIWHRIANSKCFHGPLWTFKPFVTPPPPPPSSPKYFMAPQFNLPPPLAIIVDNSLNVNHSIFKNTCLKITYSNKNLYIHTQNKHHNLASLAQLVGHPTLTKVMSSRWPGGPDTDVRWAKQLQ